MSGMTTRDRIRCMYEHRAADRVPMLGSPWGTTLARWRQEGMPEDASFSDYFDLDHSIGFGVDISPRYEGRIVEETDEYIVRFDSWGTTSKSWKHVSSTPHWIDRTIVDRPSWGAAKERMTVDRDRVNWSRLEEEYGTWRRKGYWMRAHLWFGFDVTHARIVGTERLLTLMADDPDLVRDIYQTQLDRCLAHFEMIIAEGYTFDEVHWPDDMGYRNGPFFSVDMYRDLLKPVQAKAIDWAHHNGMVARLHSCGNINKLVPELVEIGLDGLNPLEVKAGMDPLEIKRAYGDRLLLHGGLNAMLWDDIRLIEAEIRRLLPALKENGGYIFAEDHSIPDSVSLENYRRIVEIARELGTYP